MLLQIGEKPVQKFPFLNLGFRPFFLFASLSGFLLIALWLLQYSGVIGLSNYYGTTNWHSHEMLFGYTSAVIAGFLLTAVRNWTNAPTIIKAPLAAIAAIWLVARLLPFTSVAGWVVAVVDLSFFLFLAIAIAMPVVKVKQWKNLIMVIIPLFFFLANLLVHLFHLGIANTLYAGNMLAIYAIILLLIIMTGRVVPFFTKIVIKRLEPKENIALEKFLYVQLAFLAITDSFGFTPTIVAFFALLGAIAHMIRIRTWFAKELLGVPILWVLHAGYVWMIIGFILKALAAMEMVGNNLAIHAWTVGAIGLLTYGMMARVSLGHTGREMKPAKIVEFGFLVIIFAAIIRVIFPMLSMESYNLWVQLSGILWCLAFVLFIITYTKMYFQVRVDGQMG